ncbi:hypothetical protein LCGC14_2079420 [marine sediment metagenome]|uniref:SEC-C motif domain protein n=1 Tax=marine sediment metagenome TaxID=412755 RepID=A0A0F9GUE8_9ZZZZ
MSKPGRNDPCRCGSGKKYKRCCITGLSLADYEGLVAEMLANNPMLNRLAVENRVRKSQGLS